MQNAPLDPWVLALTLSGCTGSSSAPNGPIDPARSQEVAWETPVPKARCGANDPVEPGLQGQVTVMERFAGFKGTRCNLELVGQWLGEGANLQHAALPPCAYYGQNSNDSNLKNPGVVVVDASDSSRPVAVNYLTSVSFINPHEALKLNPQRKLLGSVNGNGGAGGPEFDVYDVSGDCRSPRLLASVPMSDDRLRGHEGNWAPDGNTYYGGDISNSVYYAIDVKDARAPRLLATWRPDASAPFAVHGLSISPDGNCGYFTSSASVPTTPGSSGSNGFHIVDTSDIQARKPNPQFKLIKTITWRDGSAAQHTLPVFIQGRPYLIHVDELGPGGVGTGENWALACAQGLPPFGMARIFDISREEAPKLTAKLMLEVHDPANCAQVVNDNLGELLFGYDSHYCGVDNPASASILMCSQWHSGLRVYDIRNPYRPREIAYYNRLPIPARKLAPDGAAAEPMSRLHSPCSTRTAAKFGLAAPVTDSRSCALRTGCGR